KKRLTRSQPNPEYITSTTQEVLLFTSGKRQISRSVSQDTSQEMRVNGIVPGSEMKFITLPINSRATNSLRSYWNRRRYVGCGPSTILHKSIVWKSGAYTVTKTATVTFVLL